MSKAVNLEVVKDRVSGRLMDMNEVNGVSVEGGHITVYIVEDSPRVRNTVAALVEQEIPGITIDYVRTGRFHPF